MSYLIDLGKKIPYEKRKKLIFLSVLSLISAALQVLNVALLVPFLESISNPLKFIQKYPYLETIGFNVQNIILFSCLLFMLLCIVSGFARVKINEYSNYISVDIACNLSDKVTESVEAQSYSWHVKNDSSSILSTLTNNLDQTSALITTLAVFIPNILLIVVLFSSLIALEPKVIGFVMIMMSLFYYISFKLNAEKVIRIGRERITYNKNMIAWIQALLKSIKTIKIENNSQFFLDKISSSNRIFRESKAKNKIIQETPKFLVEPFFICTVLLIIIIYDFQGLSLQKLAEPLALLAFGFTKLIQPIQKIYQTSNSIKNSKPAVQSVISMINLMKESKESIYIPISNDKSLHIDTDKLLDKSDPPLLTINNLSYKYNCDDRYILNDINFHINKGDTIALVGETGSGKSTLLDLLMGLLTPTEGEILFGGNNIQSTLSNWKNKFAYVPQDLTFTNDSIANNIAFYRSEKVDISKVSSLIKTVNLSGYIDSLENKLDSYIEENGLNLSGGQRQRLCIARALYKRTNIIFLDEATSALDNNTESLVMNNLHEMGATIILIAHRLSTTKNCSKILYLENGHIASSGTYDELMTSSRQFRKLVHQA